MPQAQLHEGVVVWTGGRANAPLDVWFHPAFGDSAQNYRSAFDSALREDARIFVIDPPGHGVSAPRPGGLDIETCERIWSRLIARFSRSRRTVLVGHSMAGIIASRAAARVRQKPSLVIGVEANLTYEDAYFTGEATRFAEPADFLASLRAKLLGLAPRDPGVNPLIRNLAFADPLTLWTLGRSVAAERAPGAEFRRLRCPKIHYWDAKGAPRHTRDYIARHRVPNRRLDGLGHWPMTRSPEVFYAAVAEDIRGLIK